MGQTWSVKQARGLATNLFKIIVVLFLVTFGITIIVRLLPGDPAQLLLPFGTPEEIGALRAELGLDKNVFSYYFSWLGNFVQGDFGKYYLTDAEGGTQVSAMIANTLPRTLLLMLDTVGFSLAVSIPLGILLAYRSDTRTDRNVSNFLFGLASIPNFAIGLALAFLVGVKLDLVNPLGYIPIADGVGEHFKSMLLPVLSLSLGTIATFTRLLRVDTIATLKEDFVTMASSKGLSNKWILWRHVFRPSALTLLTSAALTMASLIGGAVVVEAVFALDGFGMLLATSIALRQYLAIQSLIALVAIAYVLFNLIVDALYGMIDPRVRSHRGA
jgi:peptide/nickel transport system permease protein